MLILKEKIGEVMESFEYGEQFDIEKRMFNEWNKQLAAEIDRQILIRLIPRYDMMIELKKYKSDYNNCSLKDYKKMLVLVYV